jgi:ABC-2 type transport system ATP-binding protein
MISVSHLKKNFKVYKKAAGFFPALVSLFDRKYEEVKAVNNISFEIGKGELVGFIGPNGAGKTTTLKCLSGLLYPTSGRLSVLGFTPFDRKDAFLKNISLIMGQKNQLWWDLPPLETFRLNREIYDIPENEYGRTLKELTDLLGIKDLVNTPVRKLSLGERMKMELVASLIHKPKVLFLDEPTIGLDVVMQKKMRDFIKNYNKKYGATILLTSHYMTDVRELCRRVIIINHGRLIYDGYLDKLIEKYSETKKITAIFSKAVNREELQTAFADFKYDPPKLYIKANKKDFKRFALNLINNFPIEDLTIEDPDVEDIIRGYFGRKR